MPEVVSAGLSTNATPPNNGWEQRFEISGKAGGRAGESAINFISPGYFTVLSYSAAAGTDLG